MRTVSLVLFTLVGIFWGFISTIQFYLGASDGMDFNHSRELVTPPLGLEISSWVIFFPGNLGQLTMRVINNLLNQPDKPFLILPFSIVYGVIILLLIRELLYRLKRNNLITAASAAGTAASIAITWSTSIKWWS